jgi:oligoendopeptidase F
MLAMLGDAAQGPDNCFTMLESVDLRFPEIEDEEGKKVELTHANFSVYRESSEQRVRKDAFEKYFGEFNKFINTFAAMYASSVKFDQYFSDVRGFKSTAEAALFRNNVPVSVLDSLIEAVHSAFPSMKRYLEMRKDALKLDKLHMYDLYCPMIEEASFKVPFEEGKKLVLEALKPLGEGYGKLLDEAYSGSWIDVYENRGKTTGAYSCGVFGVHPYVLLNYQDKLDDAFTLAHELGHAMHSHKSSEKQDYANHDYSIMVAEVASTVNEVLLLKYLLSKETDKKRRASLFNKFLEGFRTTVFRQTLFAEFERKAHEMEQSGEPLTVDSLSRLYRGLNEQYYQGVEISDLDSIEWSRIPHFYRAYYVYQYATGFSSAVAIATDILKTGDASRYHEFLSMGGSDYPLEELKHAGVDLSTPEPVLSAMNVFAETIGELEKLMGEIRA